MPRDPTITTQPASLRAVLALTWLGNWGTAIGWSAIYFVAEQQHGFGPIRNAQLAVLMGVLYAILAFFSGWLTRLLERRVGLSPRAVLAGIIVFMVAVTLVPVFVTHQWSIWFFGATLVPVQGLMWPIVESYLSGGRRGRSLRRAAGYFNVTWASAVPIAMWLVASTIEQYAGAAFIALALAQAGMLLVLRRFPQQPAPHLEDSSDPSRTGTTHPADRAHVQRERNLLVTFRVLNLVSYIALAALGPMFPGLIGRLGLDPSAKTALASIWMCARVASFWILQRWDGWHGRWRTVLWAASLLGIGTGTILAASSQPVMAFGLACFGLASGAIYCAAIYYALEVGQAEVDAGGKHEAVMGVGYTLGPLAALLLSGWLGISSG